MVGKLVIYWDYELQTGADQAISTKGKWDGNDDYKQTEKLLNVLNERGIKSTFAVVGICGLNGELPYHSPEQIKKMSDFGHDVGSHTFNHEYLPGISLEDLKKTLRKSKEVLEKVTGKIVVSFVPPHNQPLEFYGLSIELKKRKGISKIKQKDLIRILRELKYENYRINHWTPFRNKILKRFRSYNIRRKNGVTLINVCCADGFFKPAFDVVKHAVNTGNVGVVYGHPWALGSLGAQSMEAFMKFLDFLKPLIDSKKLEIVTAKDL